jgi:N-acylneuraminate cytidylyltransferase/CMP-N,N'-diacetyllegionaminic acid synthase
MTRLCTICARGGSKGVPDKNIRLLDGRPLVVHSIDQARASGLFELVAVSSDSPAILAAARAGGADLLIERPPEMATDTAGKLPAIRHAWLAVEARVGRRFEVLVDLDCTSPLRLPADIAGAVRLLEETDAHNVITGAPAHRSPYFNLVEVTNEVAHLSKTLPQAVWRRQDAPRCYDMNASIYVWRREPFLSEPFVFDGTTRLFEMPRARSLDIDEEIDFTIVELLWRRRAQDIAASEAATADLKT